MTVAPAPATRRGLCLLSSDGVILTPGEAARIVRAAPRTVSKWFDAGRLKGWRLAGTQDRRFYARDLRAFLAANGNPVPAELDALCGGRIVVLFGCPPAVKAALAPHLAGAAVADADSEWELGRALARPHTAGAVVVGSGMTVAEVERLFARLAPEGWATVHAHGPDQRPAAGAAVAFGEDAAVIPEGVAAALAGRAA